MSESQTQQVVTGQVLSGREGSGEDTGELARVITATILNTPGVVRLVPPRWRVGRSAERVRLEEKDGAASVSMEITVDLSVPIIELTADLRRRVTTAVQHSGRTPGRVDVLVSRVESAD